MNSLMHSSPLQCTATASVRSLRSWWIGPTQSCVESSMVSPACHRQLAWPQMATPSCTPAPLLSWQETSP